MIRPPRLALGVGLVTLASCGVTKSNADGWVLRSPVVLVSQAVLRDPALVESSGVAASRQFPGVLWTHNDSGNPPMLFATDSAGGALGAWPVPGATNQDWEDIGLGPCPAGQCIYLGDVGDNAERRASVTLYRIPERSPARFSSEGLSAQSLIVVYPDRPRDVEALFVDDSATVWLVSKGRSDGVFLYRVRADAWGLDTARAERVDSLAIAQAEGGRSRITGAALSPDRRTVVIRSYDDLYFFSRDPSGGLTRAAAPNRCDLAGLEAQGEAVDWWNDSTLVLTSEGTTWSPAMVRVVRCPQANPQ